MNARRARERRRIEGQMRAAISEPAEVVATLDGWDIVRRGPLLLVLPIVPEDAPSELKEALGRRREAGLTGRCACGARFEVETAVRAGTGRLGLAAFLHEADCSASDERIAEIAGRYDWQAGRLA